MSINKNSLRSFLDEIENLFDVLPTKMDDNHKQMIKNALLGSVIKEIEETIINGRPPRMMLVGRSGHGKSSLLNALSGKNITYVSDVKPGQAESCLHYVEFPEYGSSWELIDTRGFFDPIKPDGATHDSAEVQLIADILKFKPDVLLHVINIKELRTLLNDIEAFKRIRKKTKTKGKEIPSLIVLSHSDILGRRNEWPPENYSSKAGNIIEAMEYLSFDILDTSKIEFADKSSKLKGFYFEDDTYIGVIPVCSNDGDYWNIQTLQRTIAEYLPKEAMFDFFQGTRDKILMRRLSSSIVKRFSGIATGIGSVPIPIADIAVLTPMQLLLISIIALLSGREVRSDNMGPVYEFLAAAGINVGAAVGLKMLAQQIVKLLPIAGMPISGAIAGSATYAIGKSAEAYFFMDKPLKELIE